MKYSLNINKRFVILAFIAAGFSVIQLVSTYIFHYNSFSYTATNVWLFNILLLITFFILYFIGGNIVYWLLDKCHHTETTTQDRKNNSSKRAWVYFFVILAGWSPWLYAFYPGSLWFDMCYEYDQYYGAYRFDSILQFPPFPTYIMGLLMDMGKSLFKSDNVGMFLYIALQTIVCAFACTRAISLLEEIKVNRKLIYVLLTVYAFFPDFGANAQLGANNVLNYGLTLLACTYVYRIYRQISEKEVSGRTVFLCVGYINCTFLSILWRKEMLYIYLFITAILCIYSFRSKFRKIFTVLMYGIIIFLLSSTFSEKIVIERLMGQTFNTAGDVKALSLPLRQVARFVYYHDDLVTSEEREILNRCFKYGYEGIHQNYNPNLSDSLIFNFQLNNVTKTEFYKIYMSFLMKDPMLFLESLVAGSYGYFSILPNAPTTVNNAPTNGTPGSRLVRLWINKDPDKSFGNVSGIQFRPETNELRNKLADWLMELERSFNLFFGFGLYSFFLMLLCSYSILKSKKITALIPYTIPMMLCLVCIASPVNDYDRYYMGIFYCMPFIIGVTTRFRANA